VKDVKCPYCSHEQEINHDDGYGIEEGVPHQQECGVCHKTFVFYTSILFYYDVSMADCLNGGEHTYQPTVTYPVEYTQMICTQCGTSRQPTPEEIEQVKKDRETKQKS